MKRSWLMSGLIFLAIAAGAYAQDDNYESACQQECSYLTADCTAYLECRVAKSQCLESCMQRKVWEKMAGAIDKLSVILEKQAQKNADQATPQDAAAKNENPAESGSLQSSI
jgi:hypothetical protein